MTGGEDDYVRSGDVDRRIAHAETRIKYWVILGVLSNLAVALGLGLPLVYYLGQISTQGEAGLAQIGANTIELQRREQWERDVERFLTSLGYEPLQRESD